MIENLEKVKRELAELADVINLFKSEAVQLRIIDLVLGRTEDREAEEPGEERKPKKRKRRKRPAVKGEDKTKDAKKKAIAGTGAFATINQLADTDFFQTPRTINDIIQHCATNLARRFKANELSGKLARMVRNVELTREKNPDGQYEYKKA
jgi:hypothetical protein